MKIRWHPVNKFRLGSISQPLYACLQETGSFTQCLQKFCSGKLQLHLKDQTWKRPLQDEAKKLNLRSGGQALVREIYLECDNIAWVYARSIIPGKTLRGAQRRLAHLGTRSLGSYLFSDQAIYRGNMEIAMIPNTDKLFSLALHNENDGQKSLWGRRSIFYIKDKPLLVVEIFLPNGIKCINTQTK